MGWCAAGDYGYLDSWLLKEDKKSAEVVDCGSQFHSGMVSTAKCCCSPVVEQRGTTSLSCVASLLVALGFLSRPRSAIWKATWSFTILYMNVSRLAFLLYYSVFSWWDLSIAVILEVRLFSFFIQRGAFLCTLSNMVLCFSRCGSQMIAAYSRDDL